MKETLTKGLPAHGPATAILARADADAKAEAKRRYGLALEEKAKRLATARLHDFIKQAWSTVEPSRAYKDNWHIGAVAEHLMAVEAGQIKILLINQPPATMKSLTVSVFFPAWLWAHAAHLRFMFVTYDQSLATRDSLRMRNLVESPWYRERWPAVQLSAEQNQKTRFDTTAGGWRISTSIGGRIIGEHPNGKVIDDPHNPRKQLLSELEVKAATDTWDYGLATRGATLNAWTVLLMQRLHENDLSGHVLAQEKNVVHLCLPMRYEPPAWVDLAAGRTLVPRMKTTPLGWDDPRTEPGELLWPAEWDEVKVAATEATLGSWGTAGQFQQRPAPAGGLQFKREWFGTIAVLPADVVGWTRFWDCAGTEGGVGPRTAGVKMLRTASGLYIVTDVVKGRWSPKGVTDAILQTAALDGPGVAIREEQEPGSAGKSVIASRAIALAGYDYRGVPATGDKVVRAQPLRAQAEAGNVKLLVPSGDVLPPWVRDYLDEMEVFPAGALKDQVDASSGAFADLTGFGQVSELSFASAGGIAVDTSDPVYRDAYEKALAAYTQTEHGNEA